MRSPLTKLLALMLAALTILPLTACGTGDEGETSAITTQNASSEAETENTDYVCDLPEDLDYGGEEINFLYV